MIRRYVSALILSGSLGLSFVLVACGDTTLVAPVLSVQVDGVGRVISVPRGIDCPGRCEASFAADTSVSLIAEPGIEGQESCFFVDEAVEACGGTCSKNCFVMMGLDRAVVADFR